MVYWCQEILCATSTAVRLCCIISVTRDVYAETSVQKPDHYLLGDQERTVKLQLLSSILSSEKRKGLGVTVLIYEEWHGSNIEQ